MSDPRSGVTRGVVKYCTLSHLQFRSVLAIPIIHFVGDVEMPMGDAVSTVGPLRMGSSEKLGLLESGDFERRSSETWERTLMAYVATVDEDAFCVFC